MATAVRYRIVPELSVAEIEGRTNLHPVHARGEGLLGWVEAAVDGDRVALIPEPSARVELAVDRIRSDNALFERELRRRIDARRHPMITGELRELAAAERPGRYRASGDITFRGVSRPATDDLRVTVVDGGRRLRVQGAHAFDIRDFGMDPPRLLLLKAMPEVTVRIHVEAEREDQA